MLKPELKSTGALWVMGDPFLRAYYSIYDMENKKIGMVGVATTVRQEEIAELNRSSDDPLDSFISRMT